MTEHTYSFKMVNGKIDNTNNSTIIPKNIGRIGVAFIVSFALVIIPVGIANIPYVTQFIRPFIYSQFTTFLIGLFFYSLFFLIGITKISEWAVKYLAVKGVVPQDINKLLEGLNALSARFPITVTKKNKQYFSIHWNYTDVKFAHLFGVGQIKSGYELSLKFNPVTYEVYASERITRLRMNAGGIMQFNSFLQFSFFQGISLMQEEYGSGYGFVVNNNKIEFDKLYQYSFTPSEMKALIITYITNSGWNYCPKVLLL